MFSLVLFKCSDRHLTSGTLQSRGPNRKPRDAACAQAQVVPRMLLIIGGIPYLRKVYPRFP